MRSRRCAMEPLVEARRDGRLSEREDASVERHLATCASCAALASDLGEITAILGAPATRASPIARQRGRVRLLREAALGRSAPPKRRGRPAIAFGLVAAALAAIAIFVVFRARSPASPFASAPAPASTARTVTEIHPDDGARFTRSEAGGITVVTLEDGGVTFSVREQQAEERFLVRTADAEVEVRGTIFRVEAAATHIRAVIVTEGKVAVLFRGSTTFVAGGERWTPPRDALEAEASTATSEPRTRPRGARSRQRSTGVSRDFVEGVQMLERGDYGAAADRLEAFSTANPEDSSAEDAAFLTILALQRAGRLPEAAAAAQRYLARYPRGYRRREAEQIAAHPDAGAQR